MKVTGHIESPVLVVTTSASLEIRTLSLPVFLPDYILLGYSTAADICIQLFQISTHEKRQPEIE